MTRKQIGIRKIVGHKLGELLILSNYASDSIIKSGDLLKISRQQAIITVKILLPLGLEFGIWEVILEFDISKPDRFNCKIIFPDYWVEKGSPLYTSSLVKNYKEFDRFIDSTIKTEEAFLKVLKEKELEEIEMDHPDYNNDMTKALTESLSKITERRNADSVSKNEIRGWLDSIPDQENQ